MEKVVIIVKTLPDGTKLKYEGTYSGNELKEFIDFNRDFRFSEILTGFRIAYEKGARESEPYMLNNDFTVSHIKADCVYDIYTSDESNKLYIQRCSKLSDDDVISIYKLEVERLGEYSGKEINDYMNDQLFTGRIATFDMHSNYSFDIQKMQNELTYAVYLDENSDLYVFNIDINSKGGHFLTYYCTTDVDAVPRLKSPHYLSHILESVEVGKAKSWRDIEFGNDEIAYKKCDVYVTFYNHDLYIEKHEEELLYLKNDEIYTGEQLKKYSIDNLDTDITAFYLYHSFFVEGKIPKIAVEDDKKYRLIVRTSGGVHVSLIDIEEEEKMKKYDNPDHEVYIFGRYYVPFDLKENHLFSEILSWMNYCEEKYNKSESSEDRRKYFLGHMLKNKYKKSIQTFKLDRYYYISIKSFENLYDSGITTFLSIAEILKGESNPNNPCTEEPEKENDSKTITYTDDKIQEYVSKLGLDDDFKETLNGFMDYLQNGNS